MYCPYIGYNKIKKKFKKEHVLLADLTNGSMGNCRWTATVILAKHRLNGAVAVTKVKSRQSSLHVHSRIDYVIAVDGQVHYLGAGFTDSALVILLWSNADEVFCFLKARYSFWAFKEVDFLLGILAVTKRATITYQQNSWSADKYIVGSIGQRGGAISHNTLLSQICDYFCRQDMTTSRLLFLTGESTKIWLFLSVESTKILDGNSLIMKCLAPVY